MSCAARVPVALIDYGMGNLRSVQRALEASGAEVKVVRSPEEVGNARALVFPGQGAIVDAMREIRRSGFDVFLKNEGYLSYDLCKYFSFVARPPLK